MKCAAIALLTTSLALVGSLGCSSGEADCSAAANNAVALIRADLEAEAKGDDDKERRRKESMLPALKEELAKDCKAGKWTVAVRKCVATARNTAELEACDPDADTKKAGGDPKATDDTTDDAPKETTDEPKPASGEPPTKVPAEPTPATE